MTIKNPGQITDADVSRLITESPLAAEQLRRMVAEREREELRLQLEKVNGKACLLYTSPSPRDRQKSRMPSSA